MATDQFDERIEHAAELLDEEPLRSFFLVYATGDVDDPDGEFDLEWEYAHDVSGEPAGERNAILVGAMVAALAEDGGHTIGEVTNAARQNARAIAESADMFDLDEPE
jgi:hypothetical protein